MLILDKYEAELLSESQKKGYLNCSLNFFTNSEVWQIPYLDITIPLEVTNADKMISDRRWEKIYECYRKLY